MGILKNTTTGRFHPINFEIDPAPEPDESKGDLTLYKSRDFHTEGFDTLESAQAHIKGSAGVDVNFSGSEVWEWDGIEVPARVEWFTMIIRIPPKATAA